MENLFKNYSDVYFCCNMEEVKDFETAITDYSLLYVDSGELQITLNGKTNSYHKGEAAFIRRNHHVKLVNSPAVDGVPFKSAFFILHRHFLKTQYKLTNTPSIRQIKKLPDIVRLTNSPFITGLFSSLLVYFDSNSEPSEKLIELKKEEALNALLQTDEAFYGCLFDFSDPWKIDLDEF